MGVQTFAHNSNGQYQYINVTFKSASILYTCSITDIQMHDILLVQKESVEVGAACCQYGLVGFKIHSIHHERAVTQEILLTLIVQLL